MSHRDALDSNFHALVVEDDTVTREFLAEALTQAGWVVSVAATMALAVTSVRESMPALVLCDVRLPDGDAVTLASVLRLTSRTRPRAVHAIATSADVDPELRTRLMSAGYDEVMAKPLAIGVLLASLRAADIDLPPGLSHVSTRPVHAVREHRTELPIGQPAILDDEAALVVCGNWKTVESLRQLFADELPGGLEQLRQAHNRDDHDAQQEILHRLRSSSGFCGASAFGLAVRETCARRPEGSLDTLGISSVLREGQALLGELALRRAQQELAGS